jgi:hypothetical protein
VQGQIETKENAVSNIAIEVVSEDVSGNIAIALEILNSNTKLCTRGHSIYDEGAWVFSNTMFTWTSLQEE